MKKVLILAVALASVNANATRARVIALGNSPHLIDTQTVYSNPADMMVMADYVNFESGSTASGAENSNAEGMITRSMGDSKLGLSLGHLSSNASTWGLRAESVSGITGTTPLVVDQQDAKSQQNPVGISYGMKVNDMNVAGTLIYSNFNDKTTGATVKESTAGLKLGLRTGAIDAKLGIGLLNTFENQTIKFTGTGGISAGVGYMMDDMYFDLYIDQAGFKTENVTGGAAQRKLDATNIRIGALQTIKKDGSELFYGVSIASTSFKLTNEVTAADITKRTTLSLPITLGMEVDASTWLTLRGSVSQNVIISNSKNEATNALATPPSPNEFAPGLNTTTAAVGAGLKFGKLTLDGTLAGLTGATANQNINGTNLLTTVGATYMY